jgi:hypothetical protein
MRIRNQEEGKWAEQVALEASRASCRGVVTILDSSTYARRPGGNPLLVQVIVNVKLKIRERWAENGGRQEIAQLLTKYAAIDAQHMANGFVEPEVDSLDSLQDQINMLFLYLDVPACPVAEGAWGSWEILPRIDFVLSNMN